MSAWRLWIVPGLFVASALTVFALVDKTPVVEQELEAQADAQMAADGQPWANAVASGRSVTVMGTAPTLIAQRLAVEAAGRVWGVSWVTDGSGILPLQPSYSWSAERTAAGIRIVGYVPSEDERLAILAAAARSLPGLPVEDHMELARGQPVDFLGLTDFALKRLAELTEGSVTLNGPKLSVSGTALDEAHFASAVQALSSGLPANVQIRNIRVLPPRLAKFAWQVDYDGKAATITGFVPSALARNDIATALRTAIPDISIDDQTQLASGAPNGFGSAAVFAAYQLAHLTSGKLVLEGTTLSFEGSAKTVADYEMAFSEISARRDKHSAGVSIGSIDILPASVDPYVWRADRSGNIVVLSGYMPTIESRQEALAVAAKLFPEATVTDRLRVADGDPKMDWIGAVEYALEQLSLLGKGSVSLTGRNYDVVGEAASAGAYTTLTEGLKKTLPASMNLRRSAVSPAAISPFVFAAARTADVVTFSGYVPTDEAAKDIVSLARPKFGSSRIEMRLILAGGAPDGFVEAVDAGLQAVSRLEGGRFDLVDTKLALSGVAVSEGARQSIQSAVQDALPEGFEFTPTLIVAVGGAPLVGADCQTALHAELDREKIQFENGSAVIEAESFGLIDRLAAIVQRCPAATIEIGTHTDSTGGTRKNQALSEARAQSIVDRLVEDGVRLERLSPVGYGQSRPIASNSNAAGRADNRRVEFNVVGQ